MSRAGVSLAARFEPLVELGRRLWASRLRRVLLPIVALAGAALLIRHELKDWSWALLLRALRATPAWALAASALLTPLSYACLAITEWYCLRSLGHRLSFKRAGGVAFAAYALSNSVGFSWATGAAARLRFYSGWGLPASAIAAETMLAGTAVSLSGVVAAGLGLIISLRMFSQAFHCPIWLVWMVGAALLAPAALWFVAFRQPRDRSEGLFGAQAHSGRALALFGGVADWVLSGAALYVLLPDPTFAAFPSFLAVFVLGSLVSAATGAPGGVGVFEAIVIGLSAVLAKAHETAAALILYRAIYSLGPLILTMAFLSILKISRLLSTGSAPRPAPAPRRTRRTSGPP